MRKKYQKKIIEICKEAITFARVSSEKQERGASIDAQKELIKEYCLKKGLKIIKEFEITESSTRGDRIKYNEMLDFIRTRKKKTAIVVNCVDRLQRSDEDNPALNKLRKEGKIELHFMKENIVLDETSPVHDIFAWKMNVLIAGNYTDSLSYNVKRSLVKNWNSGKWQGFAPLGYLNIHDEDNQATLIIDSVRAPIIKYIFNEYATGKHSISSIWNEACRLGLRTKQKKRKGCLVSKNTVYDVLTNPFYYGVMCVKGEYFPHSYEPLVTKEIFDRVQDLFVKNGNRNRNNIVEYAKTPYTFRGLIQCKECGCLITPEKKVKNNGNTYIYLRCGHPNKVCHQGIVNEDVIIQQLKNEVLDKISLPPKLRELVTKKLIQDLNDTSSFNKKIKTDITNRLIELKTKEDALLDFYLEGKLPQATYEAKQEQIAKQRQELEATAEKYKTIDSSMKENICKVMSMSCNISEIFDKASPTRKNQLLKILISDCKLNGKVLEYKLKSPFDKLIHCNDYKQLSSVVIEHLDEFEGVCI